MSEPSVEAQVYAAIQKHHHELPEGVELSREAKVEDLGISSLDLVEILFEIEDAFDIDIPYDAHPQDESQKLVLLGDLIAVVEGLVSEKG